MKRLLIVLVALVAVFAFVLPASAADFKFGGMFWTKYYAMSNVKDGNDNLNDSVSAFFYTRMRLYFTAIASENLKAVSKVEVDANWGDGRIGKVSIDGGSDGRGDAGNTDGSANSGFEIKNAYIDFNIPDTAANFKVGLLGAKLGKSGIAFNDDTAAIMFTYTYAPVKFSLLYSMINNNAANPGTGSTPQLVANASDNWSLFGFDVRYKAEAWSANLDLAWVHTSSGSANASTLISAADPEDDWDLYNIAADFDYKGDAFSVYFTGAVNAGGEDGGTLNGEGTAAGNTLVNGLRALRGLPAVPVQQESADFKGYLVTFGGQYDFTDMISAGLDFYWASGKDISDFINNDPDNDQYETYGVIGRQSYRMDELVFPGWFDDETATVSTAGGSSLGTGTAGALPLGATPAIGVIPAGSLPINNVTATGLTASNAGYTVNNIIAIGAHADFKPLEQTLIQPGFAYMKFAEDVISGLTITPITGVITDFQTDDSLGFSLYLRASQGITDGLTLKAALGYLIADDGYTPFNDDDNAFKLAAGLFWSW